MRTIATFKSNRFNTTEPREHFLNPCCFGDDLGRWLIVRLRARGVETDDAPDQEDFGWYFHFVAGGAPHTVVLGYREGDEGEAGDWVLWVERRRGFVASLLGRRGRDILPAAVEAIHAALDDAEEVRDLRWHIRADFDAGREEGSGRP